MPSNQSINIQHPVLLYAQPTGMTCWSAATTMLFGTTFSAGPGSARLGTTGGLNASFTNIHAFANSYGLHLHAPQSWTMAGIIDLLRRGPVAMMGALPSLHAVVIGGVSGDGTPDGTILTIYDPWPPNVGRKYQVSYGAMLRQFPMATMYLLHR